VKAVVRTIPCFVQSERPQTAVFCRPLGGLNDTLCQIELCWRYAARFGRWLVVDAQDSGLHDDLSEYFQPLSAAAHVIFGLSSRSEVRVEQLSPLPRELADSISNVPPEAFYESCEAGEQSPMALLGFSFEKPHRDPVLIHQKAGGSTGSFGSKDSFHIFDKVTFTPAVRQAITEKLGHLEGSYDAVHIRNTDYQTDYRAFFARIRSRVSNRRLLVCSDDARVVEYAKDYLSSTEIPQATQTPDSQGQPLHAKSTFIDDESRRSVNVSLLTDLVAMGRAKRLYITRHKGGGTSGYSRLARHLSDNPYVLDGLLGAACETPRLNWQRKAWWHSLRRRAERLIA